MLLPDTILQNRYRIIGQLGQGGMGTVYAATDERLEATVALKETLFKEDALRMQFEREARLLARLHHPALPKVTDHFIEGEGQFLVMQFIPGEDLEQRFKRAGGGLPQDDVLGWGDQLLDALDYLHTQNPPVLHRDIKPQNLKLTDRGQIILLDFGLAKGYVGYSHDATSLKSVFGFTPRYAPFEQIHGTGTDPRSDLYSLAATMYHLLTGAAPPDALSRVTATTEGEPDLLVPAHAVNQKISPLVSSVLERAMKIGRSQRFGSAVEMREALRLACQGQVPSVLGAGGTTIPITGRDKLEEDGEEKTVVAKQAKSIEFIGNDETYLHWLGEHPEGYVINTHRNVTPNYMVLHKATCGTVKSTQGISPGGFTERDYIKVCAGSIELLREWAKQHGRPDGSFSSACNTCKPTGEHPVPEPRPRDENVVSIDDPVVAININQQFPKSKSAEELYHATRGIWRLNRRRAERARYAFAVYQGVIKEVYAIHRWMPATKETTEYWDRRSASQGKYFPSEVNEGRSEFVGDVAPEHILKKYVGKQMPKRHSQNPILYFNC
jgi:serine/threonine protein kinase